MRDWGKIERTEGEKEEKNFFLKENRRAREKRESVWGRERVGGGDRRIERRKSERERRESFPKGMRKEKERKEEKEWRDK